MMYPNKCCRCGMCCISMQCPVSIEIYGIQLNCPALSFNEHLANCKHAGIKVPIGDGCCIKARAYKDGIKYNFASLPKELKYRAVKDILHKSVMDMLNKKDN